MRLKSSVGPVLGAMLLAASGGPALADGPPPRWIEAPKAGAKFPLVEFLKSRGYTKCPQGAEAPPGSVHIWGKGGVIAHSSVVVPGSQQVEMGHKPGRSKFMSELLPPKKKPEPRGGEYDLMETWQPPKGSVVDPALLEQMVGIDREYDNLRTRWNCHGFSANVAHKCVRPIEAIPDDKWVVWYAEKIGWQPVFVTTVAKYKKDEPSSSYPGGGLDPKVVLAKTFVGGPYDTKEQATEAVCERLTNLRRLRGVYAGLPVADLLGRVHNIQFIAVDKKYWDRANPAK